MNVSLNRQIGSVFIVVGTEVGGGILALPILMAQVGFLLGSLIMLVAWVSMTYTALLLCEINLAFEDGISFAGMAEKTTGSLGGTVVWISFLLLLYMIMVAYISAAGSSLNVTLGVGVKLTSLIFVVLLGSFVVMGTVAVDWVNRLLLTTKLFLLLFVCILLVPHVKLSHLAVAPFLTPIVTLAAIPVFVTSFTSHLIIPTLRTYLYSNVKVLTRVIIIGSLIPLFLYIIWVLGVLGVVPFIGHDSFAVLFSHTKEANVGDILRLLKANLNSRLFYSPISIFSNISVITSFLGVSLALYGFMIDGFRLKRVKSLLTRNAIAVILTFVIPLIIIWFFPNLFIKALGFVGLCCAVLLVIMPFFMINSLKRRGHKFQIRFTNNKILLGLALVFGTTVVLIQVLSSL